WGQTSQESKVVSWLNSRPQRGRREAMVNGTEPIEVWKRRSLAVRNRNECCLRKLAHDLSQAGHVKATMQRRDAWYAEAAAQGQVQPIDVTVNQVEIRRATGDRLEQGSMCHHRVGT